MKIYYDSDGAPSWVQITGIIEYPDIFVRMDATTLISFSIRDFEGALYAAWEARNFTDIKVDDEHYLVNESENMKENGEGVWFLWSNKLIMNEENMTGIFYQIYIQPKLF